MTRRILAGLTAFILITVFCCALGAVATWDITYFNPGNWTVAASDLLRVWAFFAATMVAVLVASFLGEE